MTERELELIGVGYTLASGKLFTPMSVFHELIEDIADRPIFTHELANKGVWQEIKDKFENKVKAAMTAEGG